MPTMYIHVEFCSSDVADLFGDADDISASDSDGEKAEQKDEEGEGREQVRRMPLVCQLLLMGRVNFGC